MRSSLGVWAALCIACGGRSQATTADGLGGATHDAADAANFDAPDTPNLDADAPQSTLTPCPGFQYQPGASWPIAKGCSTRASRTATEGPSALTLKKRIALPVPENTSVLILDAPLVAADRTLYLRVQVVPGPVPKYFEHVIALSSLGDILWEVDATGAVLLGKYGTLYGGGPAEVSSAGPNFWSTSSSSAPILAPDGHLRVAVNTDQQIEAWTQEASKLWSAPNPLIGIDKVTAVAADGTWYLGEYSSIAAVDITGSTRWVGSGVEGWVLAVAATPSNDVVAAVGNGGLGYRLECRSAVDGSVRWSVNGIGPAFAIAEDGRIYAQTDGASGGNQVVALSSDGAELFRTLLPLPSDDSITDILLTPAHSLYVLSKQSLRWLDKTGTERAVLDNANAVDGPWSAMSMGPDGTLYVVDGSSHVDVVGS